MLNVVFITHKSNYSDDLVNKWIIEKLNSVTHSMQLPQCEFGVISMSTDKNSDGELTDYVHTLVACKEVGETEYVQSKDTMFVFDGREFTTLDGGDLGEIESALIHRVVEDGCFGQDELVSQTALVAETDEDYTGLVIVINHPGLFVELFEMSEVYTINQLGFVKPVIH